MKRLTQLQFLDKAEKKHNKKYSYPDLVYVSGKHKIKIDCPNTVCFIKEQTLMLMGKAVQIAQR